MQIVSEPAKAAQSVTSSQARDVEKFLKSRQNALAGLIGVPAIDLFIDTVCMIFTAALIT